MFIEEPTESKKCPFRTTWRNMMNKTYSGYSVCEEWETFEAFKAWMKEQPWQGRRLLKPRHKHYSPLLCAFVPDDVYRAVVNVKLPLCVKKSNDRGVYRVQSNIDGKTVHIGLAYTREDAVRLYVEFRTNKILTLARKYYNDAVLNDALIEWAQVWDDYLQ